jgi:hypothetical protein
MNRCQSSNERLLFALFCVALSAPVGAAETLEQGLRESDFIVDWRTRFEEVEQVGFTEAAEAFTTRLRLGLQTAPVKATAFLLEGVVIDDLNDDYNSTTNGQTQYPVIADPAGFAAINRAAIINKSLDKTTLTFGRQRLVLDDQRFVGNVGWRQQEQTFDGLRAQLAGTGIKADVSYAAQVNRVFGPDSPQGKWEGDIVLANVAHTFGFGTLTVFAYGMEFDEAAGASNETVGLRLTGSRPFGDTSLIYTLSAATQSEAGLNPSDYSETYSKIEGGITRGRFTAALGLEVLGGDGSNAFVTPLATLHAFQGWGDKFLGTPANGIADSYARFAYQPTVRGPFDAINIVGFLHQFDADLGTADYGDELDLSIAARTGRITLTLKYAAYAAESLFTDTDKLWFSMDYAL